MRCTVIRRYNYTVNYLYFVIRNNFFLLWSAKIRYTARRRIKRNKDLLSKFHLLLNNLLMAKPNTQSQSTLILKWPNTIFTIFKKTLFSNGIKICPNQIKVLSLTKINHTYILKEFVFFYNKYLIILKIEIKSKNRETVNITLVCISSA